MPDRPPKQPSIDIGEETLSSLFVAEAERIIPANLLEQFRASVAEITAEFVKKTRMIAEMQGGMIDKSKVVKDFLDIWAREIPRRKAYIDYEALMNEQRVMPLPFSEFVAGKGKPKISVYDRFMQLKEKGIAIGQVRRLDSLGKQGVFTVKAISRDCKIYFEGSSGAYNINDVGELVQTKKR